MKKSYLFVVAIISSISVLGITACNNSQNASPVSDTAEMQSSADSMPVVKPAVTDSGSVLTTPPVNDDNVIMPDTTKTDK